jgi:hypothetical protein
MRLIIAAAAAATLAACGPSAEERAETNAAIANFVPPSVLSRLDFGGVIERRFRRLDRNGDDKLQPTELPQRNAQRIMRYDTDGDGAVSAEEWSTGQLARFDRQDANHDGTVTSDEREAARAKEDEALPTPADEPVTNGAASNQAAG